MSIPGISRKQFIQVVAALAGSSLLGCETEGPAGADAGPGGGVDSGGPRTDAGPGGGTDSGPGGGTDSGPGGGTDGGGATCSGDSIDAVLNTSETHTHTLSVPVADIIAGVERTYSTGTSNPGPHCHQVTVTAADFTTLQTGGTVRVYSCNFTEHEFVLSCVGTPVADGDAAAVCGSSDVGSGC